MKNEDTTPMTHLYYISLGVTVTVNAVQASRWHVPAH